jgi:DtxR family Mn-dependent transcriptional regulator
MVWKAALTAAEEEYLEAIYTREESSERVATTRDLAKCFGIKDLSVTEMLKKLSAKGLVNYTPYRGASLTEAGREIAANVKRKHRILERYLEDICGVDKQESHKQACEIEHVISDKAIDRLFALLDHPSTCPGGRVIPRKMRGRKQKKREREQEAHAQVTAKRDQHTRVNQTTLDRR